MIAHKELDRKVLLNKIRKHEITTAGNRKLKIFGQLNCLSGKRMSHTNRVFFKDADEAKEAGYRPCGHCMTKAYKNWRNGAI